MKVIPDCILFQMSNPDFLADTRITHLHFKCGIVLFFVHERLKLIELIQSTSEFM